MSVTLAGTLILVLLVLILIIMYFPVKGFSSAQDKEQEKTVDNKEVVSNKNHYEIQPRNSKIEFRVNSEIGEISAGFQDFEGSFEMMKTGANNGPAAVSVNVDSLYTKTDFIGLMLKSESFFEVNKFPAITFVGSSFEWINDKHAILIGSMTIKNVTRKVAFYVELIEPENKSSDRVFIKATANIRRSEFGLVSLDSVVSDNVSIYVDVDALQVASASVTSLD